MENKKTHHAPLGIIALDSSKKLGESVEYYIKTWRKEEQGNDTSYLISAKCERFGSGEAKCKINESIRGMDIYILVDVCNYSMTYKAFGIERHYSPDDHFADLKRVIAAMAGKATRITVIMPFLYESRQHKRMSRESLDSAIALQELVNMGVDSIITFDAHDPRIQNAIPLHGFDTVPAVYQFSKTLFRKYPEIPKNLNNLIVVSPDEGAMSRAVYYGNVLGCDVGMFYKRRDYTQVVDGTNPIVAQEFLGSDLKGKDVIIIDDMISSGGSMIGVAKELKKRSANRIFLVCTFGLFTDGLEMFDKAYEEGLFDAVLTTNLIYQTPELLSREYYVSVDVNKYVALLIDRLNNDGSISEYITPTNRIKKLIEEYKNK